jgi:hypothetical protein
MYGWENLISKQIKNIFWKEVNTICVYLFFSSFRAKRGIDVSSIFVGNGFTLN